jgi:hypothetical protein
MRAREAYAAGFRADNALHGECFRTTGVAPTALYGMPTNRKLACSGLHSRTIAYYWAAMSILR